jgi:hypothetical protein
MRKLPSLLCAALAGALATTAWAQIKSFTLDEMVETADSAIYGQIIDSEVFRVDDATDGSDLYFTRLTIEGQSMADATALTAQVVYHGGFIDETHGVFNSEAPAADDVRVGKRVVAFYKWADDMGGGVGANALVAAHGGLYRTVEGPRGAAVLGRGEGYAINANVRVDQIEVALRDLYGAKRAQKNK